jgi:3-hydroxyisobutyrate dehydrogenase-like beta-hydroxyacid dehydrogenase
MKIGVIGVGRMGLPMSRFMLKAGYAVTVCDPDPARIALATGNGATSVGSIAELTRAVDVVLSSLPDDKVLLKVALGPDGVLAHARPDTVYVDTSTVSASASAQVAKEADARRIAYIRMPVSGNSVSAEAGQLTALASGPRAAWDRIKPAVEKFSVAQVYCGAEEQARYMKLCINLLVANTAALLAESLTLGRKGGLDWNTLLDGLTASTIGSPWLKAKAKLLAVRDFTPTFTPAQLAKDVDLMLRAGDEHGIPMPMTAALRQLIKATAASGYAEEDFIAMVKVVEALSGLPTDSV